MVRFHNVAFGTAVENWWDNANQAIAFSRGDKAFILINNEHHVIEETLYTGLPDGDYCNVITCDRNIPVDGDCGETHDGCQMVTVIDGSAKFVVPNNSNPVFAIHI